MCIYKNIYMCAQIVNMCLYIYTCIYMYTFMGKKIARHSAFGLCLASKVDLILIAFSRVPLVAH